MTREEFESNLSQLHKGGAIRHEKPTEEEYKLKENSKLHICMRILA